MMIGQMESYQIKSDFLNEFHNRRKAPGHGTIIQKFFATLIRVCAVLLFVVFICCLHVLSFRNDQQDAKKDRKNSESCTFFSSQNRLLCTNQLDTFSSENSPDLYIK